MSHLMIINSHFRPVMEYGMEVWGPSDPRSAAALRLLAPIEAVLQRAVKMAVGVHATATEGASTRQRGVTPNVLLADMHVLSASDACGVAHLRYHERTAVAPAARSGVREDGQIPANLAPDLMGAAVRASMADDNAWRRCVTGLQPDLAEARVETATAGAPRTLPNRAITAAVRASTCARKAREGATEPPPPTRSSRGRCLKRVYPAPEHLNPIRDIVVAGAACALPPYLDMSSPTVLPVLALRSCHLPHDHTAAAARHYAADHCGFCGVCVLEQVGSGEYTAEERRWRHGQHVLCGCDNTLYATRPEYFFRQAPTRADLRADLLDALPASHALTVRAAFACDASCPAAVRATLMPLLLDPVKFLGEGLTPAESSLACRCVAAYLVRVGAMIGRVTPDPSRLASLRLPPQSRMAQRTPCGAVDPGSDDEVWLRDEPAPPCVHVPHAHPTPHIRPRGREAEALEGVA